MRHAFLILVVAIATAAEPGLAAEPVRQLALHETPVAVPTISFADEAGAPRSLADFRGKVVLLNIWATDCIPCRTEMPSIEAVYQELGPKGLKVVAVSVDATGFEQQIRDFVRDYNLSLDIM